jgi:hypothetical protein
MLVVGEFGAGAIAVYPADAVRGLDEDTPHELKSALPVGFTVALTWPFAADPVPTGPSTSSDGPVVS